MVFLDILLPPVEFKKKTWKKGLKRQPIPDFFPGCVAFKKKTWKKGLKRTQNIPHFAKTPWI